VTLRRLPLAAAALVVAAVPLRAQSVAVRTLATKPVASLEEPFSSISAIRELRDGRLLVTDAREKALRIVDFAKGTVEEVGREGRGPGEYASAGRLLAIPGDTTLMHDATGGRMLVVGPDATPVSTYSPPAESGLMATRATDARGRMYTIAGAVQMTPQGPVSPDSGLLVRHDRASARVDTLARVKLPSTRIDVVQKGGQTQGVSIVRPPMSPADEWAVFADGRVAVARVAPYRVDVIAPAGGVTRGPALPHEPIRVTEADKAAARAARGGTTAIRGGGGDARGRAGQAVQGQPDDGLWPEYKPPFLAGAVIAAANGETWVRRSGPADAPRARYDVVGADGRLVAQVSVPSTHRVLAVTARGVYVARSDADDLLYLERYPPPAP
jgi:hypothetical protein